MKKKNTPTTEELLETSLKEQVFYKTECAYLMSVLDELLEFTGPLEISVILNAKERHNLDTLIHAKLLFKN